MKKILTLILLTLFVLNVFSDNLILIPIENASQAQKFENTDDLTIHYFDDQMIIATTGYLPDFKHVLLDKNAWAEDVNYLISYCNQDNRDEYLENITLFSNILVTTDDFVIISVTSENGEKLYPAQHGGLVNISKNASTTLPRPLNIERGSVTENPLISELIEEVNVNILLNNIQHMQDYGTRDCFEPESVEAQNWIKEQFESYGLETQLFDFDVWGEDVSDNVIATITGTELPDEFIVLGAHYDSYSFSGIAPGADDNATGTCGIMEVARILSDHAFKRSIVFCTWSGEEYGLHGSEAYAAWAASTGMDILGYFNIDMSGYVAPGNEIHTHVIAPSSAQPLLNYYTEICSVYLPDFPVSPGWLSGGNSDHASFNNHGYMGIFPFEDSQDYSPYIHTAADTIGLSVNNIEQSKTYTQAILACVADMAEIISGVDVVEYDYFDGANITIFPNPFNTETTISISLLEDMVVSVDVYSLQGKKITELHPNINSQGSLQFIWDGKNSAREPIPAGIYLVRVSTPNGVFDQKVIRM